MNQSILENKDRITEPPTDVYISLYVNYLYELIRMQDPISDKEIVELPFAEIVEIIRKRISEQSRDSQSDSAFSRDSQFNSNLEQVTACKRDPT